VLLLGIFSATRVPSLAQSIGIVGGKISGEVGAIIPLQLLTGDNLRSWL
jgi:hypothetical protein